MASASGAFVAGNLVKSLAETGGSLPREMQVESYWRIDPTLNPPNKGSPAMTKKDSAESLVVGGEPDAKGGVSGRPACEAVESPRVGDGVVSAPSAKEVESQGEEDGDQAEKLVSPSRATSMPRSAAPSSSTSTRTTKFDKYYHKKLAGTCNTHPICL